MPSRQKKTAEKVSLLSVGDLRKFVNVEVTDLELGLVRELLTSYMLIEKASHILNNSNFHLSADQEFRKENSMICESLRQDLTELNAMFASFLNRHGKKRRSLD